VPWGMDLLSQGGPVLPDADRVAGRPGGADHVVSEDDVHILADEANVGMVYGTQNIQVPAERPAGETVLHSWHAALRSHPAAAHHV
jgi:hypothetical protein